MPAEKAANLIKKLRNWESTVISNDSDIDKNTSQAVSSINTSRSNTILTILRTLRETSDIIVCVHNALDDVRRCLESLMRNTDPRYYQLFIVNDGSHDDTTEYLREFCSHQQPAELIELPESKGYTKAANKGLKATTSDYVVLLNSDTIVPDFWLDRLVECGESNTTIGIIGPLSNAASYQSVPDIRTEGKRVGGQFASGWFHH